MIPLVYKGILLKNAMGFNRTFMELKHEQYRGLKQRNDCFNRTFMELKPHDSISSTNNVRVLIGPSWN